MANKKRLIDANALIHRICAERDEVKIEHACDIGYHNGLNMAVSMAINAPTVDAVEVPCHCCDCYYLLNGKNSFGLYFFCGHENGLKNLKNTEKDFCMYGKRRYENEIKSYT